MDIKMITKSRTAQPLALLTLPLILWGSSIVHGQESPDLHSITNTKAYAEGVCLTWAKEDEIPQRKLEQFLSECIADITEQEQAVRNQKN